MSTLVGLVYNILDTKTLSDCQKLSVLRIIQDASRDLKEGVDYSIERNDNFLDLTVDLASYTPEVHIKLYEAITSELI